MEVQSAEFIKSSAHPQECPPDDRPEYAFIGRSNVGKSSLINMLTNRKALAKISSTPGKTQLINHFVIDDGIKEASGRRSWYLVDLPGFGYAKVSKTSRVKWQRTSEQYLTARRNLMCVMMLIDSRHPPQKVDLEFMAWMGEHNLPFVMVFTKVDKLNQTDRAGFLPLYKVEMLKQWHSMPPVYVTSSEKGEGREEVLRFIDETNALFEG
ncbi:MAG TPA: YihA family ribosome biogenesis GTP-binding protein [Flavobacteriales bacterium]|jgi:GTP-binding protein|nr:YihA family ribosome biogenesis GTP-binding protein [Flavobacteriales bacterium]